MGTWFFVDARHRLIQGFAPVGNPEGTQMTTLSWTPDVSYRFPLGFSASARLPILWRTFSEPALRYEQTRAGIGDLELVAGLEPLALAMRGAATPSRFRLAANVGLTVPTGAIDPTPLFGLHAPTIVQLGSGTVDPLLSVSGAYSDPGRWSLDASVSARVAVMQNVAGFRPSTVVTAIVGGQFRPTEWLSLEWHLEGAVLTRAATMGRPALSTGRQVLYAVPGFEIRASDLFRISASVRIPVLQHVEDTQLAETYSLLVRLAFVTPPLIR